MTYSFGVSVAHGSKAARVQRLRPRFEFLRVDNAVAIGVFPTGRIGWEAVKRILDTVAIRIDDKGHKFANPFRGEVQRVARHDNRHNCGINLRHEKPVLFLREVEVIARAPSEVGQRAQGPGHAGAVGHSDIALLTVPSLATL